MDQSSSLKQPWFVKGPFVFEGVVSQQVCREMQAAFLKEKPQARTFNGLLQQDFRHADFIILEEKYLAVFSWFIKNHLEAVLGIRCRKGFPHLPILYRYPVGVGFKVHHDGVNEREVKFAKRTGQPVMGGDITMILGINDPNEYEGGELFFPNHDLQLKFNPGMIVAYPNTEEFLHGVKPIIQGERYSLVCRVNV